MSFLRKIFRPVIYLAVFSIGFFLAAFLFKNQTSARYPWYETISMYHVFVKSFYDSNGDGKGDLKGLINKLDYIKKLNINTIYMLPITPALNNPEMPRSHYGYEIKDFKNIHDEYGTLDDFKRLIKESHDRGIHIVLDFITTVISVQHPFFQDILNNPNSKYKDWIVRADEIPDGDWMNFNDYSEQFQSKAWKPLPHGGYYYSLWGDSPFLNYHNPEVREYIFSVVDFWLDLGADGFRIDATKHLFINGPGQEKQYHQPENFEFWRKLRKHITKKYGPEKTLIAETIPIPNDIVYIEPDRTMFDSMFDSIFINDIYPYQETDINLLYSAPFFHSFFNNPYVFKLTKLQQRILYHSDHDGARLATRLKYPTPEKLKLAASILILTPSHTKIYAGDEIGIKGFSDFKDFKNKWFHATVTSMAWDDTKNAGFTTADTPIIPITDDYKEWNVKAQEAKPDSLLKYYRRLLALKKKYPQYFFKGERYNITTSDDKLYSYLLSDNGNAALVIMNLSDKPKAFKNDFSIYSPSKGRLIFGDRSKSRIKQKDGMIEISDMPAYSTYVFKFSRFDTKMLETVNPATMKQVSLPLEGIEKLSDNQTAYNIELPVEGAVLRIFKNQGNVLLGAFSRYQQNYTNIYQDELDTSAKDILIPLTSSRTDAVVFSQNGIRFAVEHKPAEKAFPQMKKLWESMENKNLRALWSAKDKDFWYFKIDKLDYALQSNGGLDFALFINTGKSVMKQQWISFWRLPEIISRIPINDLILYERHIRTGKVQTDINAMRPMGISIPDKSFIFETPNAFWIMVSRKSIPEEKLDVSAIVWSAAGNWGDTPPQGKPAPIVERLPFDLQKTYDPRRVDDYVKAE